MNIEELLALARQNVKQASRAHDATSAAIAQAAAMTAAAMLQAEWWRERCAASERDDN